MASWYCSRNWRGVPLFDHRAVETQAKNGLRTVDQECGLENLI